jgi:hypothetical protein
MHSKYNVSFFFLNIPHVQAKEIVILIFKRIKGGNGGKGGEGGRTTLNEQQLLCTYQIQIFDLRALPSL